MRATADHYGLIVPVHRSLDITLLTGRMRVPPLEGEESGVIGRPPQTPEEIARHRSLTRLEKHAFESVTANFSLPDGRTYVLTPLKYTPRYSVIYEVDPNRAVLPPIDPEPGQVGIGSDSERLRIEEYNAFIDSLPREENQAVMGDIYE